MLNTFIKNKGISQTIIRENNKNHFNEINWDADYDGNTANFSFNENTDGKNQRFDISLDNEDLINLLNIPSVNTPIDERLQMDFGDPLFRNDPRMYQLEEPFYMPSRETSFYTPSSETINQLLTSGTPGNYISSPSSNEELIIPITIDEKSEDMYTLTPRRRHKRIKTHKTHRVYKKPKSKSSKNSKRSKNSKSSKRVYKI